MDYEAAINAPTSANS